MQCEHCGEREACVEVTRVVNGSATKLQLCEQCAKEQGISVSGPIALSDVLLGFGAKQEPSVQDSAGLACPRCGMKQDDFRRTGRLGCPACYEAFEAELKSLLEAMHRGLRHVGKRPVRESAPTATEYAVPALRKELDAAVAAEDFEEAARVRDLIQDAEIERRGDDDH